MSDEKSRSFYFSPDRVLCLGLGFIEDFIFWAGDFLCSRNKHKNTRSKTKEKIPVDRTKLKKKVKITRFEAVGTQFRTLREPSSLLISKIGP